MTTIPDHVLSEAVGLLNSNCLGPAFNVCEHHDSPAVITVAKLLMNPPAPMVDHDEEAANRVINEYTRCGFSREAATEQMRKEREAWEARKDG